MNGMDWSGVVVVVIVGLVVLLAIHQVFSVARANIAAEGDTRHAELAQRYEQLATDIDATQRRLAADVAELKQSVAAMERLMAEV